MARHEDRPASTELVRLSAPSDGGAAVVRTDEGRVVLLEDGGQGRPVDPRSGSVTQLPLRSSGWALAGLLAGGVTRVEVADGNTTYPVLHANGAWISLVSSGPITGSFYTAGSDLPEIMERVALEPSAPATATLYFYEGGVKEWIATRRRRKRRSS